MANPRFNPDRLLAGLSPDETLEFQAMAKRGEAALLAIAEELARSRGWAPSARPRVTRADELPVLLTIQEAAALLRTSVGSIYQRVSRGQLTKGDGLVRDGSRVLFHRDRLLRFLENGGRR
ncbi:MAG: helix-turn-helix domain-containing protein [Polyangiaceae bacterium]|nr:helix-turn-helix domain-containing protein [Polyangiaceae bacterium]